MRTWKERADDAATAQETLELLRQMRSAASMRAISFSSIRTLARELLRAHAEERTDDGEQTVIDLTVAPPLPFVPNFDSVWPQVSTRTHAALFDTTPSTNVPLMLRALERRFPIIYEPPRQPDPDDGPERGHVGPHPNNAIPGLAIPGRAIPGVGYYGPEARRRPRACRQHIDTASGQFGRRYPLAGSGHQPLNPASVPCSEPRHEHYLGSSRGRIK
jgi:hypothetical protein